MTTRQLKDLGALAQGKKQYKKALGVYEELRTRAPDDPYPAHRAGELFLKLGKKPEAVARLTEAARLYAAQSLPAKANAVCRLVLQFDPENDQARTIAAAADEAGAVGSAERRLGGSLV